MNVSDSAAVQPRALGDRIEPGGLIVQRFAKLNLAILTLGLATACSGTPTDPPPPAACPTELPTATVRCDDASCAVTTGTKAFAISDVASADATEWLVISHVASDLFTNDVVNLTYEKVTPGALTARRHHERLQLQQRLSPKHYETLFGAKREARLRAEHRIREASLTQAPTGLLGTGIRGLTLPEEEELEQDTTCSQDAPACDSTSLCVIAPGETTGACQSALSIKWRDQSAPGQFIEVAATVRKVGQYGAIVTDDADTVSEADISALLDRFDSRIAPLDHAFFGEPVDAGGKDRDGNGVVILFLTSKVADIDASYAGFFQATDLQDPTTVPSSNGADLLYMQPPSATITLDNLSGTLAHEYEHLISFYAKVINRQSSPEERWLDEGLATFAEDVQGYGADSFKNIAAYLATVGETSLTGFGLNATNESDADSNPRRGMMHLLIRYMYEQRGGATLSGPAELTDGGGVAAVRALVQSADTGVDLFSARGLKAWLQDLLTVVAIDGANYPGVSCNKTYTLAAPEPDDYTGYTRGIDLRTSMVDFEGGTIPLNGPTPVTFESEDVPVPSNGGEIRSLSVSGASVQVRIGGDAESLTDYAVGLRIVPTNRPQE